MNTEALSRRLVSAVSLALALGAGQASQPALAAEDFPTVSVSELSPSLVAHWNNYKPDLGPLGHCATAFERGGNPDREVFTCSIFVKISAVAARKAMTRCEEMREAKGIKAPCRLIKD